MRKSKGNDREKEDFSHCQLAVGSPGAVGPKYQCRPQGLRMQSITLIGTHTFSQRSIGHGVL